MVGEAGGGEQIKWINYDGECEQIMMCVHSVHFSQYVHAMNACVICMDGISNYVYIDR